MTTETLDAEGKRERAIQLANAKPLYFWWVSENLEVKKVVDSLYQEFLEANPNKNRKADKYRRHLFIFVADPYKAYTIDPEMWVKYSRNRNEYKAKTRYTFMTYDISISVSDFLIGKGYLEMVIGYPDLSNRGNGKVTQIRATDKLIKLLEEAKVELSMLKKDPNRPVIKFKDKDKRLVEFTDNPMTLDRAQIMRSFNERLNKMTIGHTLCPEQIEELKSRGGSFLLDTSNVDLTRTFVRGSWERGGRLSGGFWQTWPPSFRKHLIINGKPVTELDYESLHPTILYHSLGLNPPQSGAYSLEGYSNDKVCRKFLKLLMLVLLNARDVHSAIGGIRKKVNLDGLTLPSDVPDTTTMALEKVMTDLAIKHSPIQKYLCVDKGVELQMKEANINVKILEKFRDAEIPLPLPEYDSFIVACDKEEFLRKAMVTSYKEIIGPHYSINIDKKY